MGFGVGDYAAGKGDGESGSAWLAGVEDGGGFGCVWVMGVEGCGVGFGPGVGGLVVVFPLSFLEANLNGGLARKRKG